MFLIPVIPGVPVYICAGVLIPSAMMTPEERALANEARRGASEAAVRRAEAFGQSGGGRAARAAEAEHKRAATGSGDDHYARMAKDWAS